MELVGIDRVCIDTENGRELPHPTLSIGLVPIIGATLRALVNLVPGRTPHAITPSRIRTREGGSPMATTSLEMVRPPSVQSADPAQWVRSRRFIGRIVIVSLRVTDDWLELAVRFLVSPHGIRNAKDAMSRRLVEERDTAGIGIGIASATGDIVGFPPIEVRATAPRPGSPPVPVPFR